jgi:hypothetical protein
MLAGFALVHGQTMVRGQVAFMRVTVTKQQSKKEWYTNMVFFFSFRHAICIMLWHYHRGHLVNAS